MVGGASAILSDAIAPALSLAITISGLHHSDGTASKLETFHQMIASAAPVQQLNRSGALCLALAVLVVAQLAFFLGRRSARKQQKVYILDFGVHKPDSRCAIAAASELVPVGGKGL